jgi:hypothetical protein
MGPGQHRRDVIKGRQPRRRPYRQDQGIVLRMRIGVRDENVEDNLDLARIRAAPSARLCHLAFEGQGAFASQC